MKTKWTSSDLTKCKPINCGHVGNVSLIEFQDSKGEYHNFEILASPERIIFGGYCNAGFLESGYILRDDGESINDTLTEMLSDLETYYNDGAQFVSRIVCNERM
jgi:hypothetical protein